MKIFFAGGRGLSALSQTAGAIPLFDWTLQISTH